MKIDSLQLPMQNNDDVDKISFSNLSKKQKLVDAEKVAKEFETLYVEMLVKSMRATAKPEDESNAQDIYTGMLDSEYAKVMSDRQSFGLREMILQWMKDSGHLESGSGELAEKKEVLPK